jgi:hypothetical protein
MMKKLQVLLAAFLVVTASCNPVYKYINSEDVLKWEQKIAEIDSLNAMEIADTTTLLVTGSSSVRLWDSIHSDLSPFHVMQRGYGGAKMTDFCFYADRIIQPQTHKAILVFVANDIAGRDGDRSPKEVFQLFKTLVKQIRERNPDTPVFWIETTPTPRRWHAIDQIREANGMIRNYCEKHQDLHFIGTYPSFVNTEGEPDPGFFRKDSLHLNRTGYVLWADIIMKNLEKSGINP